jgi:hypothetical protein
MLWENMYKKFYSQICDFVIPRIYFLIFGQECPRLSKKEKNILTCIGNWYLEEKYTYLRIYGAMIPPHVLPIYVPDSLVIEEICYQNVM